MFIVGIIILGIITSYTDIRYGKISNKHILSGIIYAILINTLAFFSFEAHNWNAYLHYFISTTFTLLISFIFWNIGLWTAGDAKLFFVFNLLTPPDLINIGYKGMFYGLVFFTNIFGTMLFFFIFKLLIKIKKKEIFASIKKTFKIKDIAIIMLFIFAIGAIFRLFSFEMYGNFFLGMLIIFIGYSVLESLVGNKMVPTLIIVALIRVIIDFKNIMSIEFLKQFLTLCLTLLIARFLLLRLSFYAFTQKIKVRDLKEKMFLAEDIWTMKITETNEARKSILKKQGITTEIKYQKQPIENLTIFAYLRNKPFFFKNYDKNLGLSKTNIEWFENNKNNLKFHFIRVYETMPFAPFISVGVLTTILVKGDLFLFLIKLITKLFAP